MNNNFLTYYQLLDVEPNATTDEIILAYKIKAKLYHPDKNSGHHTANKLFQLINQAKTVLTNPKTRLEYDYSIGVKQKPQATTKEKVVYINADEGFTTKELLTIGALGLATGFLISQAFKTPKRKG